ncbi:zinc protease [Arenimonas maotaiensis]|uniref:Zinc protease n=1 Tax=Arenimonas maotaiensis TaxID=1446479 RepID=A0A917FKQ6_9GAMM|nr:pitrilysin family protein [Arenimonas maotaiensis]GGF88432.1 zinc protease [Arenimonas maotaiensis]
MRSGTYTALALALGLALSGSAAYAPTAAAKAPASLAVDIPYEQFTLPNGLRVVVHTDRKAPIVAVNIWYHVGSKDETPGRTGFAHLFEHLMFQGSENYRDEFFGPFERVGATDQNGTTNSDRTNYFQNVPTTALDMALWMESDRMGHFLGAVDQALLDEQRGVVQNEKRQGENQPYGVLREPLSKALFPKGHPYSWTTIGSMNDLNAASLEDVKSWFRRAYGPNNAVLVLAGDIDLATAKEKVAKYFGDIPAAPDFKQPAVDVAPLKADARLVLTDKVPQVSWNRLWNVAQSGAPEEDDLDLFAQVLGGSGSSRLDRRLVHEEKLVDSISTSYYGQQLSGRFSISAAIKQGVDPKRVEAIVDEELKKLLADGPTQQELDQAKVAIKSGFIRQIERIGGFGGKADVLAACAVYRNDPGCFRTSLANIEKATVASVKAAGNKWLNNASLYAVVEPGERKPAAEEPSVARSAAPAVGAVDTKFKTLPAGVDRSLGVPKTETFPDLSFPALQRATLSNGLNVVLASRPGIPVVQMNMLFGGGFSTDAGKKLGTASFATNMLTQGAGEYDALAFAAKQESLGANIGSGAGLDGASASLSAIKEKLEPSLALYADMLRKPRFDAKEIERVRAQWLATIKQEKVQPQGVVNRVLPGLMYGAGHPYAIPSSGTGTEADIAALTRDDLLAYHNAYIRPDAATLVVTGDTTLAEIVPLLEKHLGDWKGAGAKPAAPAVAAVPLPKKPRVFLIDQPGSVQANIFAGQLVPSSRDPNVVDLDVANGVFGGTFTSRLNMNLRENKRWSYGARSGLQNAQGPRPWIASAGVQIDKTAESMAEMDREIREFASGKNPTKPDELAKIQNSFTLRLPGSLETNSALGGSIADIVRYDRPDDYVLQRSARIKSITLGDVQRAAAGIQPDSLTWVVVGDLSKIKDKIAALNIGPITVLDNDGKPVKADGKQAK